jgi:hypothetical protein
VTSSPECAESYDTAHPPPPPPRTGMLSAPITPPFVSYAGNEARRIEIEARRVNRETHKV